MVRIPSTEQMTSFLKDQPLLSWWFKYQQERLRDCVVVSAYPAVFTIALSEFTRSLRSARITRMLEFSVFLLSIKMKLSQDSPLFARKKEGLVVKWHIYKRTASKNTRMCQSKQRLNGINLCNKIWLTKKLNTLSISQKVSKSPKWLSLCLPRTQIAESVEIGCARQKIGNEP